MVEPANKAPADESDMWEITVQDLDKQDTFYHVMCEPTATVEHLKCNINIETGIEIERQVLSFRQGILRNDN